MIWGKYTWKSTFLIVIAVTIVSSSSNGSIFSSSSSSSGLSFSVFWIFLLVFFILWETSSGLDPVEVWCGLKWTGQTFFVCFPSGGGHTESQRHRGVTTPARVSEGSRGRVNQRGMLSKASEFICLISLEPWCLRLIKMTADYQKSRREPTASN